MKQKVYSFDVFDTSLVRIWAHPHDLFWDVGQRLDEAGLLNIPVDEWATLRQQVERRLVESVGVEGTTFTAIYSNLSETTKWSPDVMRQAMEIEGNVELASLKPVPATVKAITDARKLNSPIVFFSDMYLPGQTIQTALSQHGLWRDGDRLYVSGDHRADKSSGKLFLQYLTENQIEPTSVHHTGDNPIADVQAAQTIGMGASPFTATHLNRYEQAIAEDTALPRRLRSLLSGASRLTRLSAPTGLSDHEKKVWDIAASVSGPLLFGFAWWCLEEAKKQGKQRLYFVSRDGQIPYLIARQISKQWGYDIECRYLYGSRYAWLLPNLTKFNNQALDALFTKLRTPTIRSLCHLVHIEPAEHEELFSQAKFPPNIWDTVPTPQQVVELRKLFTSSALWAIVLRTSQEAYEKTIGYLYQEGLGDGTPSGMVDSGWTGTMPQYISQLLDRSGSRSLTTLSWMYFVYAPLISTPQGNYHAFFFDSRFNKSSCELVHTANNRAFIELIMVGDHGQTEGYIKKHGVYEPYLSSPQNDYAIKWGLKTYQQSILSFTNTTLRVLTTADYSQQALAKISNHILSRFIIQPTTDEAETFGSMLFMDDLIENDKSRVYELAPPISNGVAHELAWLPGSWAREKNNEQQSLLKKANPSTMLNIGCGERWHPEWINLDSHTTNKSIENVEIRFSLPYSDESFTVVYHAHVLERYTQEEGRHFIQECFRVLRPGGIIRIVVPNLETLARNYLMTLEKAERGTRRDWLIHEWSILELLDPLMRTDSGGEAKRFIYNLNDPYLKKVVTHHWRGVAKTILAQREADLKARHTSRSKPPSFMQKLTRALTDWRHLREALLKQLLAHEYTLLQTARWRESGGEIHKSVYDSHVLGRLLNETGFVELTEQSAINSYIFDWARYELDSDNKGQPHKPNSLYVEGKKPPTLHDKK